MAHGAPGTSFINNDDGFITFGFLPAVPANWIVFSIYHVGLSSGATAYNPQLTFTFTGGAGPSDFVLLARPDLTPATGSEALTYNNATGVVTKGNNLRQGPAASGTLIGTTSALVSSISLNMTGILAADQITFSMASVPTCLSTRKVSVGDTGSFNYSYTNLMSGTSAAVSSESVTTTTAGTPATSPRHFIAQQSNPATLTETIPSGYLLTSASCTDSNSAISGNPSTAFGSLVGNVLTVPAANFRVDADIVCTFTNTKQPILRLSKTLPNGRIAAGNQFTLNIAGTNGPASATTTGATNTPTEAATLNNAAVGASYTLSEVAAGTTTLTNYASSLSCSNTGTGGNTTTLPSGSGTSFNVTPAAGDNISCVYSNAAQVADLSISKAASPTSVIAGGLVTYTLTANNAGPVAANNSVLRDAPGTDLDCTQGGLAAPTCSASGGAACPAGLTNAALTGSGGVTIPTFPAGGGVVVTMQCRATANGVP